MTLRRIHHLYLVVLVSVVGVGVALLLARSYLEHREWESRRVAEAPDEIWRRAPVSAYEGDDVYGTIRVDPDGPLVTCALWDWTRETEVTIWFASDKVGTQTTLTAVARVLRRSRLECSPARSRQRPSSRRLQWAR
jgi:hypothetical protein